MSQNARLKGQSSTFGTSVIFGIRWSLSVRSVKSINGTAPRMNSETRSVTSCGNPDVSIFTAQSQPRGPFGDTVHSVAARGHGKQLRKEPGGNPCESTYESKHVLIDGDPVTRQRTIVLSRIESSEWGRQDALSRRSGGFRYWLLVPLYFPYAFMVDVWYQFIRAFASRVRSPGKKL